MDGIINDNVIEWCRKYSVLFRMIFEDEELRNFFREHCAYTPRQGHHGIYNILDCCLHEAYDSGVVIDEYCQILQDAELPKQYIAQPTKEWLSMLTAEQILAIISWHFRQDHFCEGRWIAKSVADGHMSILVGSLLLHLQKQSGKAPVL